MFAPELSDRPTTTGGIDMKNLGLLIMRLVLGTLMAAHGAQKLFGWWSGPGLKGTHGFMEMLGMRPGKVWGTMAAVGETSGGVLTFLGLLNPIGPLNIMSAMTVAIRRVHWKTPVWASEGGAELPLVNMAAACTIALVGPGDYSLDRALGFRMPRALTALAWLSTAGITVAAVVRPEIAETVVQKASTAVPSMIKPTSEPGIEVETRSATPSDATIESTASESGVGL
jgi:putative oxidoreductase